MTAAAAVHDSYSCCKSRGCCRIQKCSAETVASLAVSIAFAAAEQLSGRSCHNYYSCALAVIVFIFAAAVAENVAAMKAMQELDQEANH